MTTAARRFAADDPRARQIWCELEARADAPYFLSWGWIENWLACLPPSARPELAVIGREKLPFVSIVV